MDNPAETGSAATAHATFKGRVAVLVVQRTLLRVRQHFVGLLGLLEFLLRRRIVRAAVRVVLHRQAAKGFLQIAFGDRALDTQDLVVITLAHSSTHNLLTLRWPAHREPCPSQQTARTAGIPAARAASIGGAD